MHRTLQFVSAASVAAVVLILLVFPHPPWRSPAGAAVRANAAPRVTAAEGKAASVGGARLPAFRLELPEDWRPAAGARPADVRVAPPVESEIRLGEDGSLSIEFAEAPAAATAYEAVFACAWFGGGGAERRVPLTATPLDVRGVYLDQSSPPGEPALLATFGAPVARAALARALRVAEPGGAALPLDVREAGELDAACAFRIAVKIDKSKPEPAALAVEIDAHLAAASNGIALAGPYRATIALAQALEITSVDARPGRIDVAFNAAIPLPARDRVEVEPNTAMQIVRTHHGMRLLGEFAAGRTYDVLLRAGFPGGGRATLERNALRRVVVRDPAESRGSAEPK